MVRSPTARATSLRNNGLQTTRTAVLGLAKVLFLSVSAAAAPVRSSLGLGVREHNDGDDPDSPGASLWVLYVASLILVLLGGAFAGLTIALMGQDGIYLQVLARDENEPQKKNARRVHDLLQKGKHWVLVTLLLSNVIVNETLPVVLDRCLGGGVAAVVGSTFLIVIFGEILPQSVCVRYGLPIGGYMSKPVLILMWLLAPVAWPTAKLLDWLLGEDHGTVYKKSGLKTLVTLHRSLGEVSDRLNQDEVTIISAVLDLREKPVEDVMTPMEDVFVMAEDTVLDEKMMDLILSAGYSRIPIHEPGNPTNFVGMLLVKILITYDPEDCKRVRDFPLATLPETRPETSCLDIVNFFQEGKSHMVLVSEYPGEDHGAIGVVTLEDVIEELIGEEIIDESDVYIDVHKAIRRLQPAPRVRIQRRLSVASDRAGTLSDDTRVDEEGGGGGGGGGKAAVEPQLVRVASAGAKADPQMLSSSPKTATFMLRRSSAGIDGQLVQTPVPVRASIDEVREALRHLGPSNPATNPKNTRSTTVKIKPGVVVPSAAAHGAIAAQPRAASFQGEIIERVPEEDEDGDETTQLLRPRLSGKDGIRALRESYGSVNATEAQARLSETATPTITVDIINPGRVSPTAARTSPGRESGGGGDAGNNDASGYQQQQRQSSDSADSPVSEFNNTAPRRSFVRSGSITENVVETRGIRKVVLETTSSTDEDEDDASGAKSPPPPTTPSFRRNRSSANVSAHVSDVEEEEDAEADGAAAGPADGSAHQRQQHHGGKKRNRRKKRKGSKS